MLKYIKLFKLDFPEKLYIETNNKFDNATIIKRAILYFFDLLIALTISSLLFEKLFFSGLENELYIFLFDFFLSIVMISLFEWKLKCSPFKLIFGLRLITTESKSVALLNVFLRNIVKLFTLAPIAILIFLVVGVNLLLNKLFKINIGFTGFIGLLIIIPLIKRASVFLRSRKLLWYDYILKTRVIELQTIEDREIIKNYYKS